jgi:hypothetical protein
MIMELKTMPHDNSKLKKSFSSEQQQKINENPQELINFFQNAVKCP